MSCNVEKAKPICDIQPKIYDNKYAKEYEYYPYYDIDIAKQCSYQTGRPILIIFTGWNCMSQRGWEWKPLESKKIKKMIDDNFILCALYVDDKTKLEAIDTVKIDSVYIPIKTLGQKNSYIENHYFNINSQPYYAIVDYKMKCYGKPMGINSKTIFADFLDQGLKDKLNNDPAGQNVR